MNRFRSLKLPIILVMLLLAAVPDARPNQAQSEEAEGSVGKDLFERETFGGNGRTCLTCHSRKTGTVSSEDAQTRFAANQNDSLFIHDGSDDGLGNGATRMLTDATVLVEIPLPPNVSLADDPHARSVTLRRGIPTTLNTPALDPVLMLDGRHRNLRAQARAAIRDHAQNTVEPRHKDLRRIALFQQTDRFFSSPALRKFARGGSAPKLPPGYTESEQRGRRFFEDVPFSGNSKAGTCAACHSGPMLNETNRFLPLPLPPGSRFQDVLVSDLNTSGNPVRDFVFTNPDGTKTVISSPDPGRALITGESRVFPFDNVNAFKIPSLWGVRHTAPYFHDNSAKTLEEMVEHYAQFFEITTDPSLDGDPTLILTEQDKADIVAFLKLLN
jgi:cytochrome c peroxidase